jgi:anthranilate phosphoribosyltransferase
MTNDIGGDLKRLIVGDCFTRDESTRVFKAVLTSDVPLSQVAALLTILATRNIVVEELLGALDAMLSLAVPLKLENETILDICGTGGDGKGTFNISTLAAFVVAGAGVPVVKHGNYGFSSSFGSSNLLEALGIKFSTNQKEAEEHLKRAGATFLHAPNWHPALKKLAPLRKELKFRTIFNILGPLANPARPTTQMIGVAAANIEELIIAAANKLKREVITVRSEIGHDECVLSPMTYLRRSSNSHHQIEMTPNTFGLKQVETDQIKQQATPELAKNEALSLLSGDGMEQFDASGAKKNVIIANAALALQLHFKDSPLTKLVDLARESLESGRALLVLESLRG